jgi:hypothetical protein
MEKLRKVRGSNLPSLDFKSKALPIEQRMDEKGPWLYWKTIYNNLWKLKLTFKNFSMTISKRYRKEVSTEYKTGRRKS